MFDIPFGYDPALEVGYDPGTDTGVCSDQSQVLTFNCDVPTTFDCGGSEEPRDVTANCPTKAASCSFWDNATRSWSSDGCSVVANTASGVTCACTHLTDFSASTTAPDADVVVSVRYPTPSPTTLSPTSSPTTSSPGPSPRPTPRSSPAPTPLPGHPTAAPVFAPTPRPTPKPTPRPTRAPSPIPTPMPTTERPTPSPTHRPTRIPTPAPSQAQTLVQVASSVTLEGVNPVLFNADKTGRQAAFAQSIMDSTGGLFEEIIDIEAAGRRRLDDGAGVAISYTGIARIDGTDNGEQVSAELMEQSMDALTLAIDDGSFLTTLQAADSAFAAVTVDEMATYAAIAAATVVFVVTTPAPTTSPSPRPTSAPSLRPTPKPSPRPTATPSSGAPGGAAGDDDGAADDGAAAAAPAPAPASGGGGSDSGGGNLIIIVVVLLVVVLMLLSGIGGYLVSTRRGNKISAVAVAVAPVEDGELTTDRWATARREERCMMKASPRVLPMVTPTDAAATHFPRPDDGDRVTPEDAAATHFPPSGAPRRQAPDLEDQV